MAQQEVAHGAADEVEPVPGRVEAVGEGLELGQHGSEAFGDHGGTRLGAGPVNPGTGPRRHPSMTGDQSWRAAPTTDAPGPPFDDASGLMSTPARAPRAAAVESASAWRS